MTPGDEPGAKKSKLAMHGNIRSSARAQIISENPAFVAPACASMPERMNARLQRLAGHLHALGPRAVAELLSEVAAGADVMTRLERYARLDPAIVHALGGADLPIDSVRVVNGGRR